MNLKSVGYFREMPDANPNDPSIKDFINRNTTYPVEKICNYLDRGIPIIVTPGTVMDVIDENKGIAGSPSVLTDGKWAWSGVLSYYVKNYRLLLNIEFINSMCENQWKIPIREDDLDYSDITIDDKQL